MALPDPTLRGHCQTCGIEVAANRYYCDEHRPAAKPKKKKDKDAPAVRPATPVAAVKAIAAAGAPTTEAARKKAPTAAEWREKMSLALALLTTWLVLRIIARSDISSEPDDVQDAAADRLEMGNDEVDAIVDPVVALITGPLGSANKKFGRQAMELLGVLPAALAFTTWRARVRDFERQHCPPRQRGGRQRAPQPARTDDGSGGEGFPVPYLNGAQPAGSQSGLVAPHPG